VADETGPHQQVEAPVPLPEDPLRRPLLETLQAELGGDLVGFALAGDDLWVRVKRSAWRRAGAVCRDSLGMRYFCFLAGIDWLDNPALLAEKAWDPEAAGAGWGVAAPAEIVTGVAGGETRFQVFARLYNVVTHVGITLKADLDGGFDFVGHPRLRHLYLPTEFEGRPLRKDFPLLARMVKPWPGLVDLEPLPGEPDDAGAGASAEEG